MVSYNGIELELGGEEVSFSHSRALERDRNTRFSDALRDFATGTLTPDQFRAASRLSSLINLNYQVMNGGIEQYFDNGYDAEYLPDSGGLAHLDKDEQVYGFRDLALLAPLAFQDGSDVADEILDLARDLDKLENVYGSPQYYEVDEDDPFCYDNPVDQMEAAYDAFDNRYYKVGARIEALIELRAQYLVKSFGKEDGTDAPTLAAESRDMQAGCGRLSQGQDSPDKGDFEKASDR